MHWSDVRKIVQASEPDFMTMVLSWVALDLGLNQLADEILLNWALA